MIFRWTHFIRSVMIKSPPALRAGFVGNRRDQPIRNFRIDPQLTLSQKSYLHFQVKTSVLVILFVAKALCLRRIMVTLSWRGYFKWCRNVHRSNHHERCESDMFAERWSSGVKMNQHILSTEKNEESCDKDAIWLIRDACFSCTRLIGSVIRTIQ